MASPMPVLPDVPSTIVPPGFSRPARSASSIIFTAMRSLIELPGLKVSILASTVASVTPFVIALMRTSGVWPMVSRIVLQMRMPAAEDTVPIMSAWRARIAGLQARHSDELRNGVGQRGASVEKAGHAHGEALGLI